MFASHVPRVVKMDLQKPTKQIDPRPGKGFEESFDPVGGDHIFAIGRNRARLTGIPGKWVKIGQVSAGTIGHETKDLLEDQKIC